MQCPKCHGEFSEQTFLTRSGEVVIDKCKRCFGIWFDKGEAEMLKDDWAAVSVDDGDQTLGMIYNEIRNIDCPRCQQRMQSVSDPKQSHITYELCPEHGFFMDAGEFSDFRELTMKEAFDYILDVYNKDKTADDPSAS